VSLSSVFSSPKGVYSCLMDYFTLKIEPILSVESSLSFSQCSTILDDESGIIWEGSLRLSDQSLDVPMFSKLRSLFQTTFHV
jgi:hypothetical protein